MPPPIKIPNRPPSVASTKQEEAESRPGSPRKSSYRKAVGKNENGEINIQVVVRCR
jgi:hypothetical protein